MVLEARDELVRHDAATDTYGLTVEPPPPRELDDPGPGRKGESAAFGCGGDPVADAFGGGRRCPAGLDDDLGERSRAVRRDPIVETAEDKRAATLDTTDKMSAFELLEGSARREPAHSMNPGQLRLGDHRVPRGRGLQLLGELVGQREIRNHAGDSSRWPRSNRDSSRPVDSLSGHGGPDQLR
jgi:hypothetical protein